VNTQVLYDVVMKINDGKINFDVAMKTLIGNVKGAREVNAMHVMAVLTLTGNCVNHDFLRRATLTEPCKKQGVNSLFPNNNISSSQMKRSLLGVVCRLDLSEFIVENLLCESVHKKTASTPSIHPSQSRIWMRLPITFCVGVVVKRRHRWRKTTAVCLPNCQTRTE
jgi:hypothetical protein